MTAREQLGGVRRVLAATIVARAVLTGLAAGMLALIILRFVGAGGWMIPLAVAAVLAVAGSMLRQLASLTSLSAVALWVEKHEPRLRWSLVTAADGVQSEALENQVRAVPWAYTIRAPLGRSLVVPLTALLVVGLLSLWTPVHASATRSIFPPTSSARGEKRADVLASVRVIVSAPAYSGRGSSTLDDPTSVDALVGSMIRVSGNGDAALVTASADSTPRIVGEQEDGWTFALAMPARPAIVRLRSSAGKERLIVLAPIVDAPPAVTLLAPARDSILRVARGSIMLHSQLRDDIGLHDAAYELVVSAGSGENFTFRMTTIGRAALGGRTDATLDARLSLDSLALQPGDILQLRAVARDANNVTGPGVGSSETRNFRVARADEYDSVAVDAAPPGEAEGQVLSQRMLIMLTEAVQKKQRTLSRAALLDETRRIANDQAKLRKKVGDVVFQRMGGEPLSEEDNTTAAAPGKMTPEELLKRADEASKSDAGSVMDVEGDETPILAISKPLLEAFNAMWDAQRSLEVGEPARAIPPMRIALAAIQKARQAERIYLRGKPSAVIVDVAKARLTGKDKGTPGVRESRVALDPVLRRRNETFERVTALLSRNPDAAADSLLLMRVDALSDAPALASALDDAARMLRRRDIAQISAAWTRVRRLLGGEPLKRAGVSSWSGVP